jgi:hypothetical protein
LPGAARLRARATTGTLGALHGDAHMLIRNYGLLWERSKVEWGRRGSRGRLRGYGYPFRNRPNVDFAEQAGIYVLYEGLDPATHRVVYVGQAGMGKSGAGLYRRLHDHTEDNLWNRWTRFSWFGIYEVGKNQRLIGVDSRKRVQVSVHDVLNHVEAALLSILEPPLNAQRARWKDAVPYWQYIGEDYDRGDPHGFRASPDRSA